MAASLHSVENSIIPLMEKTVRLDDVDFSKYTTAQGKEIQEAVSHLDEKIRVVSFNILFDLYDHNLDEQNRWPARKERVFQMFKDLNADIVGVQEVYSNQLGDMMEALSDQYEFFGSPCKDGEINGIFYKKERFTLEDLQIWYLSKTDPNNISASSLTMIKLTDKINGKAFAVFNAHLAFSNIDKRDMQARLIREHLESYRSFPIVLTGDFNTFPNRLDLVKLPFYDGDYIERVLKGDQLEDARNVSLLGHLGPYSTFTNDGTNTEPFQGTGTPGIFLDHIFISQEVQVLLHAVNPGLVEGCFPSDHMPVVADLIIRPGS